MDSVSDNQSLAGELLREYAECSQFHGTLEAPTFSVEGGNPACGDKAVIAVELASDGEHEIVKSIRFVAHGCMISKASAGLMAELVQNQSISKVLSLTIKDLESGLGAEFRSRVKCALLPLYILQEGLKKYTKSPSPGASIHVSAPRNLGM